MRRRSLLISMLAGASAATGCLDTVEEEILGVQAPEYTDWIPATFPTEDGFEFTYYDAEDITDQDGIEPEDFSSFPRYTEKDSISLEDLQTAVTVKTGEDEVRTAATGGFDTEGIAQELEKSGFVETDEEGVYRIFESEEDSASFGLSLGSLVESRVGSEELIRMIDAEDGDVERLVEANEEFKNLVNRLETGTVVSGRFTQESSFGETASGERFAVDGETTQVLSVYVFENSVRADDAEEDIKQGLESEGLRNVTVGTELSVLTATGEFDTSRLRN